MRLLVFILAMMAAAGAARAESVVASLSERRVEIRSNFVGTELMLFGLIERDARTVARAGGYDVAVIVRGPDEAVVTRRKNRVAGIWVNTDAVTFPAVPSYYAALTNRPIEDVARDPVLTRHRLGLGHLRLDAEAGEEATDSEIFRVALVRRKQAQGLYFEGPDAVEMMTNRLFSTRIQLPANIRTGGYRAHVFVFADGALVATERLGFWVTKEGFEAQVFNLATRRPLVYGIAAVAVALLAGWLAGLMFRRD